MKMYELAGANQSNGPSTSTWHHAVQDRFQGIFEEDLIAEISECGHHMKVPEEPY